VSTTQHQSVNWSQDSRHWDWLHSHISERKPVKFVRFSENQIWGNCTELVVPHWTVRKWGSLKQILIAVGHVNWCAIIVRLIFWKKGTCSVWRLWSYSIQKLAQHVPKTEILVGNIKCVLGVPLNVNKENSVNVELMFRFNVSHPDVFIYTCTVQHIKHNIFVTWNVISGRHVSTPSESSSGPLKVQIQSWQIFIEHSATPNTLWSVYVYIYIYIYTHLHYEVYIYIYIYIYILHNVSVWDPRMHYEQIQG